MDKVIDLYTEVEEIRKTLISAFTDNKIKNQIWTTKNSHIYHDLILRHNYLASMINSKEKTNVEISDHKRVNQISPTHIGTICRQELKSLPRFNNRRSPHFTDFGRSGISVFGMTRVQRNWVEQGGLFCYSKSELFPKATLCQTCGFLIE